MGRLDAASSGLRPSPTIALTACALFPLFTRDMNTLSERFKDLVSRDVPTAILTGAGISAESGVPTFRGEGGLWQKFRPEELANVDAFMANPDLVWSWYQHRRQVVDDVEPNPGHYAIAKLEEALSDFSLITQNVDGLHARAGSRRIYELHGNIQRNKCMKCGKMFETLPDETSDKAPQCDSCSGKIRPDVVWFGEMLPEDVIDAAFRAAERSSLFLSVGTSAIVQPAASLPIVAKNAGAYLIEINTEPTVLTSYADLFLRGKSGEILPRLIDEAGLI